MSKISDSDSTHQDLPSSEPIPIEKRYFKAIDQSDYVIIKELHKAGIGKSLKDEYGDTALHKAAAKCDKILVNILVRAYHCDTESLNKHRNTPIHEAVISGSLNTVKLLLRLGANPNAKDINDNTVLHKAVLRNQIKMVEVLIEAGGNLNQVNAFAETPLSLAVLDIRSVPLVKLLIFHGASIKIKRQNLPLLHDAVLQYVGDSYLDMIKLLVVNGADPNELDFAGRTALHYAALNGNETLISYFLSMNCDYHIKDRTLRNAYDIAKEHGSKIGRELLMDRFDLV